MLAISLFRPADYKVLPAVWGLVDSGATHSMLPVAYAGLLGWDRGTLNEVIVKTTSGDASAFEAPGNVLAALPEFRDASLSLSPLFIETDLPVWGIKDFFRAFRVEFEAAARPSRFFLHQEEL